MNKQFNNPPGLLKALNRLDEKFFCPEDTSKFKLTAENIEDHVLIKGIRAAGYNAENEFSETPNEPVIPA